MIKLQEGIYWTGYIDWNLRNFHGYSTPSGSTYNAYLIVDEHPTLIDTVKYYGYQEMLERIRAIIDPAKIEYIISNHTEMDHSGSIDALLAVCPKAQVVCSPQGRTGLIRHFKKNWNMKVVATGETLSTGEYTLQFFHMPMVHWPDSMATYCQEPRILFPNDAFGQHYASSERFADQIAPGVITGEAAKYYANIVMPYGAQVIKALEALKRLPIDMICPSHGLIWRNRQDIDKILGLYAKWANYESDPRAVIIYDTMWHSTEKMALRLYEALDKASIDVKLLNLQNTHISDIITHVMNSKFVLIGSPILNNKVLPTVAAFLTYMRGLKPKNRFGFTFGSYGWAKTGFKELEEALQDAGIETLAESVYCNYIPDEAELNALAGIVEKIKEKVS